MSNPNPNPGGRWARGMASPNPGGRRKGLSITSKVRDILELGTDALAANTCDDNATALARTIVAKAINGDMKAIVEVWCRVDGKLANEVKHSGSIGTVADAVATVEAIERALDAHADEPTDEGQS